MKKIKIFFRKLRPVFPGAATFLKSLEMGFAKRSFLQQSGFMRSVIQGSAVDAQGNGLPWFNYSVIDLLQERLPNDARVFEFGAGASTEFFSKIATEVFSVESSRNWANFVKAKAGKNSTVFHIAPSDMDGYVKSIGVPGVDFDVVLVDGLYRMQCLEEAFTSLTGRGIVIVDDVNDTEFWDIVSHRRDLGFRALPFHGLKPGSPRRLTTTILYRPGNCLSI